MRRGRTNAALLFTSLADTIALPGATAVDRILLQGKDRQSTTNFWLHNLEVLVPVVSIDLIINRPGYSASWTLNARSYHPKNVTCAVESPSPGLDQNVSQHLMRQQRQAIILIPVHGIFPLAPETEEATFL